MTTAPHTVGSDQTVARAHQMMREHSLRHLPVLRGGKLVGVLSQRDLYFLEAIAGVDATVDRVSDAMTPDVYTVDGRDLLTEVVATMCEHKYGCAVVVDRAGVRGIFTATDAMRLLGSALVTK